jgi:hypothetical protein
MGKVDTIGLHGSTCINIVPRSEGKGYTHIAKTPFGLECCSFTVHNCKNKTKYSEGDTIKIWITSRERKENSFGQTCSA